MLGSLGKCALERGIAYIPNFTGRDAEAAAKVIRDYLKSETKEFSAIEVAVVPVFVRPAQEPGCKIPGIMKVRHITRLPGGDLLARHIACFTCLEDKQKLCASCTLLPISYPPRAKGHEAGRGAAKEVEKEVEQVEEQDLHLDENIPDVHGLLSAEDPANAEEGNPEEMAAAAGDSVELGEIYWAKERRGHYWPCQAVTVAMVPPEVVRRFGQVTGEGVTWVKLFGRDQFKPLAPWQLAPFLPNTPFDLEARELDPEQMAAYNLAVYARQSY